MPWTKYLRDELFVKAGLKETFFFGEPCFHRGAIAIGRGGRTERGNSPDDWLLTWSLMGNGGMISTAGDLWRWCRALEGDALLDAAHRERLFTGQVRLPAGGAEGYGWICATAPSGETQFEVAGGDDFGFLALLTWRPKSRVCVALTSNSRPPPGSLAVVAEALHAKVAAASARK